MKMFQIQTSDSYISFCFSFSLSHSLVSVFIFDHGVFIPPQSTCFSIYLSFYQLFHLALTPPTPPRVTLPWLLFFLHH